MLLVHYPRFYAVLLYLDPGSGSFLIQLLLAVILGAGVAIRIYWNKLKGLFVKKYEQSGPVTDREKNKE